MNQFNGLLVNHAQVMQMSQDLATAVKNIESRMHKLEHDLNPLHEQWDGDAKNAYQTAKTQWDNAIEEMKRILERTAITVAEANQDYQDTDRIASTFFPS